MFSLCFQYKSQLYLSRHVHNFIASQLFTAFSRSFLKNNRTKICRTMSRKNGNGPKLDLKLNLSPPTRNTRVPTPSRSTVSPATPPISCVSSEANQEDVGDPRHSSSPEASSSSMVLAGCPRCLMYIMLSEEDPRCPKCGSTVLLDVLQDHNSSATAKNAEN